VASSVREVVASNAGFNGAGTQLVVVGLNWWVALATVTRDDDYPAGKQLRDETWNGPRHCLGRIDQRDSRYQRGVYPVMAHARLDA
jgi:hypothetical protein